MAQPDATPALTAEHVRLLNEFIVDYAIGLLFGSRALFGGLSSPVAPGIARPIDLEVLVITYAQDGKPLHQAAIAQELKVSPSAVSRSVSRLAKPQPPLVEVDERHGVKIVRASEAGRGVVIEFFAPMLPLKLLRSEKRDHSIRLAAEASASVTARLAMLTTPEKALTWLNQEHRSLEGKRPLDVIVEGDFAAVELLVAALEQRARTRGQRPRPPRGSQHDAVSGSGSKRRRTGYAD